ncbi:MAG TPA: NUDIX hydrolase [Chloroflexota bacterium]|jgi:ADP-ribose pyrophosphatase|nr:NUDIX hydrolase [Chloroflexota bacterium]
MSRIQPEVTVATEVAYSGSYISVRRDTVRTGSGVVATREIVLHPPVVVMVPLNGNGDLVMVRQYRKAVERELLELPAGGIDEGESAEDAVRREMIEETGLVVGSLKLLGTIFSTPGMSDEVMHIYRVWDLTGDGVPTEPADEIAMEVISRGDALKMAMDGRICDAKSIVGIAMLESASLHNEEFPG